MKWRQMLHVLIYAAWICGICCLVSCDGNKSERKPISCELPDTLTVGTLYSPTSYFIFKGDIMGYDYDLINRFAQDKNILIQFEIFRSINTLIEQLDSGRIDVIAYSIPITSEFNRRLCHCGIENIAHQVLIQQKSDSMITDVTQLAGKEIYVEKGSKYELRLRNLNNEIGGGIRIHTIDRDTIMTEDLIELVAEGKIPFTISDSDIAQLDHTYYANIDMSLVVSFPQRSSWAVRKDRQWLADSINAWAHLPEITQAGKSLYRHYFETSKMTATAIFNMQNIRHGRVSPYDDFFKKYAKRIGWDWRLLAAQGFAESNFNPQATSWAGAQGIMQLMPTTARKYGLSEQDITDPEKNIATAVQVIRGLDQSLSRFVPDTTERKKFIIAAYNSGIAHIYDAIALAEKYGKDPQVWNDNVSETLLLKAYPEYYNDSVCKYGYFRGQQTIEYVQNVFTVYHLLIRK